MIEDISLRVTPKTATTVSLLKKELAMAKGVTEKDINDLRIVRRSIDARQKMVKVNITVRVATGDDSVVTPLLNPVRYERVATDAQSIIIVGERPAGLFAALKAIELGMRPIVVERGHDVDTRRVELAKISKDGKVDPESNYCFGEGGAGAYSDGKLLPEAKKRGNVSEILQILHQHGPLPTFLSMHIHI